MLECIINKPPVSHSYNKSMCMRAYVLKCNLALYVPEESYAKFGFQHIGHQILILQSKDDRVFLYFLFLIFNITAYINRDEINIKSNPTALSKKPSIRLFLKEGIN